jgi:hypothetical protein
LAAVTPGHADEILKSLAAKVILTWKTCTIMEIDTQRTILKKYLQAFILAIVFVVVISVLLITYIYEDQLFGLTKYHLAIIFAALYVLYMVFNNLRQFYYIYFSDSGDRIVLRYFPMGVFTSKKNSIEIAKNEFVGYEIKKQLFGLREKLILKARTGRGLAKYPPVSLTALNHKEKENLFKALDRLKS